MNEYGLRKTSYATEHYGLIFIIFKKDNALAVLLKDKPKKYKYNP